MNITTILKEAAKAAKGCPLNVADACYIDKQKIRATNLETFFEARHGLSVNTEDTEAGVVLVKELADAIALIDNPVILVQPTKVTVTGNGSSVVIGVVGDPADYPDHPDIPGDCVPIGEIPGSLMKYRGKDEMRLAMTGIGIGPDGACATDAHTMLAFPEIKLDNPVIIQHIVPDAAISVWDKFTAFESDNATWIVRNIDAKFPQWGNIVPDPKDAIGELTIGPDAIGILKRASVQKMHAVVFANGIIQSDPSQDGFVFRVETDIKMTGMDAIAFNPAYILKLTDEATSFELYGRTRAAVSRDGHICLIMPVLFEGKIEGKDDTSDDGEAQPPSDNEKAPQKPQDEPQEPQDEPEGEDEPEEDEAEEDEADALLDEINALTEGD